MARIYLDNAATSWPKPAAVPDAVDHYLRHVGVAAGRGTYHQADEVGRMVQRARYRLAQLIGSTEPNRILWTSNGTDALNLAIHGLALPGDHVVTTQADHNSVLRPLYELQRRGMIEMTLVPVDGQGIVSPDDIATAIRPTTRWVALTHASNVNGAIQPIREVGRLCRQRDLLYLVDAAQTVGGVPISVEEAEIDLLAAPGHKGLLGPLGTGFLYVGSRAEPHLHSTKQGGTGTRSESLLQPDTLPDKFESGNLNVPGLAGLDAGLQFLVDSSTSRVCELTQQFIDRLRELSRLTLFAESPPVGIVSFTVDGESPQEFAALLDSVAGIQVRAGLHCAPEMHRALGTLARGGTIRASLGRFSEPHEVDIACETIAQMVRA